MSDFVFDTTEFEKGFTAFLKKWHKVDIETAKPFIGDKFIHDVATGSGSNEAAPPRLTGRLRGSGSAFVDGKCVADTSDRYVKGTPYKGAIEQDRMEVVIFFNTEYATRWHENPFNPGPISLIASGVATDKYLEKHLKSDGKLTLKRYASKMRVGVKN